MSESTQRPERDRRTPVVVIAGLPGRGADGVRRAASLLGAEPGTVVVRHDLTELREGVVRRIVELDGRETVSVLELAHGCVSCTLRADLLPYLCLLAERDSVRRIVLALDPAFEAEAVCQAIREVTVAGVVGRVDGPAGRSVRIEAVLTCLDGRDWLSDALGDETLSERGHATVEDDRTIAQLAVGQVEFADALVAFDAGADPMDCMRTAAVLARLAPQATVSWVADPEALHADDLYALLAPIDENARRGAGFDPHGPLLRGQPPLDAEGGVQLVEFETDRPFHPDRLHSAIDVLLEGVVSVRGRVWLATQPDEVVWLESAGGGMRIGGAGKWLAAMTPEELEQADPARSVMASLRWHEQFGDRHTSLVILVNDADADEIRHALHWALVDEDELRQVRFAPERVAQWEDPFGDQHEEPCEETRSTPVTGDGHSRQNER
ncbi:ribosome hibernation factor-recruiting GTPase MRF [Nocardia huaxiensis]|uniref:GTP-binding protein n=1 Tax=Nocardia huaxiensis TaxID=2755382 RepID=A0A7D6VDK2_9NOCA|nr:GTP-binding protein [Nocardia huaxiensis]QLY32493.1 GTP-binding protein [Nocardia huaxiensis]UFS93799.1 GTP-binding protein [Nocardia huaxiensis]